MNRSANYTIDPRSTPDVLILRDVGPWDQFLTITNAAEQVVEEQSPAHGRRLLYYDSDGELTELVHKNGKFVGFAYVPKGGDL